MNYTRISADCHLDLPWMPPDLFTSNASAALKDRMPFTKEGPDGPYWTCKNGQSFGRHSEGEKQRALSVRCVRD